MKYKICAVSGTRADYGVLKEILKRIEKSEQAELQLVVTGSHLGVTFGNTQSEILRDGFDNYVAVPIKLGDDTKYGMARATGDAIRAFADSFDELKPDALLLLGDRYETFAAAVAAHLSGIPIAHISGGDVTEGAVDDALRHSITKMSMIHFPGCEQSRKRIIQMGEDPDRVFNVGEPGVENCLKTDFLSREELAENVGFYGIKSDYCIVTFHPATMENNTGERQVRELIMAMDDLPEMNYIITLANADAGGRAINELWKKEGMMRNNWFVIPSLGVTRYLSAMKYAKIVIGNSSSGIIEAPSLGIPTVNIGNRQKGRMMADSIICCMAEYKAILGALKTALSQEFQKKAKYVFSPFGDGNTSEKILKHLLYYLKSGEINKVKHFYDIDFQMDR